MHSFIKGKIFPKFPCTYTRELPYLDFIIRTETMKNYSENYLNNVINECSPSWFPGLFCINNPRKPHSHFRKSCKINYNIPVRYYHYNDSSTDVSPTMLICHANSEDIGQTDPEEFADQFKVNICLFDYAGYGLHSNTIASEHACQADVLAVYDYLVKEKNMDWGKFIIYGRSLGS